MRAAGRVEVHVFGCMRYEVSGQEGQTGARQGRPVVYCKKGSRYVRRGGRLAGQSRV